MTKVGRVQILISVMLLIFMSEHMFRSRDQSVKIWREFFQIYKHGVVFLLPTLGPDTTVQSPIMVIFKSVIKNLMFIRFFLLLFYNSSNPAGFLVIRSILC